MTTSQSMTRTTRRGRLTDPPSPAVRAVEMPLISQGLWAAVQSVQNPHPDVGVPAAFSASLVAQARHALPVIARVCAPPSEQAVRLWLAPLAAAGLGNTPDGTAIGPYVAALMMALEDVPGASVRRATQARALRQFTGFWPSVGAVYQLLAEDAAPLVATRKALERIAA